MNSADLMDTTLYALADTEDGELIALDDGYPWKPRTWDSVYLTASRQAAEKEKRGAYGGATWKVVTVSLVVGA